MTVNLDLVQGDTNDARTVQLGGIATIPVAATLEAHVWRTTTPASTTTLEAETVDADEATVLVKFADWIDDAALGTWRLEVQVTGTWSDGETGPRTFPSARDGHPLYVRAAGG